ncbi:hypothetical protein Pla163_03350 [Planctomycetes bacterium Pla163]|uniref:Uncharacterized protein n=1 Tax=Rohdeia mirabilis TaxID=2528008 RepID=A0A518CVH5_9BACT|nr:hypothetical protein Pla163_03350 [Planctomycetes bacterium Pla163]
MDSDSPAPRPLASVLLLVGCVVAAIWLGADWIADGQDDASDLARVTEVGQESAASVDRGGGDTGALADGRGMGAASSALVDEFSDTRTIAGIGSGPTWLDLVTPRDGVSGALVLDARIALVTRGGRIVRAGVDDGYDAVALADAVLLRVESPAHEPRHVVTDPWLAASIAGGPPRAVELTRRGRVMLRVVDHEESDALSLMLQIEHGERRSEADAGGDESVPAAARATPEPAKTESAQARVDALDRATLAEHFDRLDALCDTYGAPTNVAGALANLLEDETARALLDPAVDRIGGALRGTYRRYLRDGSAGLDGLPVGEPLELDLDAQRLYRARVAGSREWRASTDFAFEIPASGELTIELVAGDWARLTGVVDTSGSAGRVEVYRFDEAEGDAGSVPDPVAPESRGVIPADGTYVCERLTPGRKRVVARWITRAPDGVPSQWMALGDVEIVAGENRLDLRVTLAPDRARVRCVPRFVVDGVEDRGALAVANGEVNWSVALVRDGSAGRYWGEREQSTRLGELVFEGVRAGVHQVVVEQGELRGWLNECFPDAVVEIECPREIVVGMAAPSEPEWNGSNESTFDPTATDQAPPTTWTSDGTPVEFEFVVRVDRVRKVVLEVELPESSGLAGSDLPHVAAVARERSTGAVVRGGVDWDQEIWESYGVVEPAELRRIASTAYFDLRLPVGDWELVARLAPRWTAKWGANSTERGPLDDASYFATASIAVFDVDAPEPLFVRTTASRAATIVVDAQLVGRFGSLRALRPAIWSDEARATWGADAETTDGRLVFHGCVPGVEYTLFGTEHSIVAGPAGSVVELSR